MAWLRPSASRSMRTKYETSTPRFGHDLQAFAGTSRCAMEGGAASSRVVMRYKNQLSAVRE